MDGCHNKRMTPCRLLGVSLGENLHIGSDKHIVLDGDSTLIEERTAEIDKYALSYTGILAEGCVEGRKHTHLQILLPPNL